MTTGSILLGLSLFILVVLFLIRPFLNPAADETAVSQVEHPLVTKKALLLDKLRALDFDHDTGKIPTEVYTTQRTQLMTQAANTLRQIDFLPVSSNGSADVVAEIEAAIANLRQKPQEMTANGRFCTQCGQTVSSDDKFCAGCGHSIS